MYVADPWSNGIQKFDSDGSFITKWGFKDGTSGSGAGEFDRPAGVAIDSYDNVYVADTGDNRIQKYDSIGNFITE